MANKQIFFLTSNHFFEAAVAEWMMCENVQNSQLLEFVRVFFPSPLSVIFELLSGKVPRSCARDYADPSFFLF